MIEFLYSKILGARSSHACVFKVNIHLNVLKGRFASEYKHGAMNEASGGLLVHQRTPCLVRQNIYELQTDRMAWVSFVLTPSSHCLKQITSLSATSTFYLHSKGGSHGES